jgi:type IV secretion system protein VirB5
VLKKATQFAWIEDLRLVTSDGVAQRKAIDHVYGRTQTVSIEVKSVLQNSERTYEIERVETTHDLNGGILANDPWKGAFTIAIIPPVEERLMRLNPLGIYVINAAWTKVLKISNRKEKHVTNTICSLAAPSFGAVWSTSSNAAGSSDS